MTRQDGGYRLPYDMNPERFCIQLSIPKDMNHVIAFTGALYELTRWWNWERDSQHRATEAAAVWRDVLQQLVGQIDYSNPTEPTPCESETMPVQFRVSETCILEYSNDGETWTAVQGWSNFAAACFVGPEGPQGPEGEPGVIGAQVVRVDGDTPPDFYLTPETKILTAVMQEQWFRGIRSQPLSTPLEGHIPPHVIEIQTYDNPSTWLPLAYIPSQGTAFVPPPVSDDPLTDEEKKCLAAMNATEVFMRTFADIGAHLTEQLFADPLELMRALADSVIGLLTRDPARSFFDELATIISFLVLQAEYASTVFDADDRAEFQQLLLDNASINPNGGVSFDREAVLIYMNARWTGQIPFVHQWGLMMDLVRFTGTEGLDRAGAVTFFTEPDCGPEPDPGSLVWNFSTMTPDIITEIGIRDSSFGNPGACWRAVGTQINATQQIFEISLRFNLPQVRNVVKVEFDIWMAATMLTNMGSNQITLLNNGVTTETGAITNYYPAQETWRHFAWEGEGLADQVAFYWIEHKNAPAPPGVPMRLDNFKVTWSY